MKKMKNHTKTKKNATTDSSTWKISREAWQAWSIICFQALQFKTSKAITVMSKDTIDEISHRAPELAANVTRVK